MIVYLSHTAHPGAVHKVQSKNLFTSMPLFYQHTINDATKIGVWHVAEAEDFFLKKVPLSGSITHWHKRLQHLAGRYLLQELFTNFPYHLIAIADTRRPFLPDESYHFSISHCGDYAAVIISTDSRVGVDLEIVSSKVDRVKHKFLNAQELTLFAAADIRTLTLCWCIKEAVFKWYGNGEVDFRRHIHIISAPEALDSGKVYCRFLKEEIITLDIDHMFFGDMCLAWII